MNGWTYYNHAAIPTTPPHIDPDLSAISNGDIWKMEGRKPLFATYTTNFDCGYETNWWYVIKDTTFDIDELKAKRRYEINKGNRNFDVLEIDPLVYEEELYLITVSAFESWPKKYRPTVNRIRFANSIKSEVGFKYYGAFLKTEHRLCGYAKLQVHPRHVDFSVLRVDPIQEKNGICAAICYKIVSDFHDFLESGGYILDGSRSIRHETAFQDYLEKYFLFRKAYCKLWVCYKPMIRLIVKIIFPFRRFLNKLDFIPLFHEVNSLLTMEKIRRENL